MVGFHGLSDGKIIIKKWYFFVFCVEMSSFSQKSRRALSNWKKIMIS